MNRKLYHLYPCELSELGKAADHAFFTLGYFNKEKWYIEKMIRIKMMHLV